MEKSRNLLLRLAGELNVSMVREVSHRLLSLPSLPSGILFDLAGLSSHNQESVEELAALVRLLEGKEIIVGFCGSEKELKEDLGHLLTGEYFFADPENAKTGINELYAKKYPEPIQAETQGKIEPVVPHVHAQEEIWMTEILPEEEESKKIPETSLICPGCGLELKSDQKGPYSCSRCSSYFYILKGGRWVQYERFL